MLVVPRYIHALGLPPFLELLARHATEPQLEIQFSELQRVSPSGLAALTAFINWRLQKKLKTVFHGLDTCPITELANNVHQHSGGVGFVAAQTNQSDGFVRIAIADCGQGIPGSLKNSGLPWAQDLPDEDIIERAMVARVSSKRQPTNEGVGLTLSSQLLELMGGHMLVTSLGGSVIRRHGRYPVKYRFEADTRFPGTLVAMSFKRSAARDFPNHLQRAKQLGIPLRESLHPANFQP